MPEDSAASAAAHFDGAGASLAWSIPFVGLLLSIALLPLVAHKFWEHHFGKVAAFWAFALIIPVVAISGFWAATTEILHAFLHRLSALHHPAVRIVRRGGRHPRQRQSGRHAGHQHGDPRLRHAVGELSRHDRRLHGADPPDHQGEPGSPLSHPRLRVLHFSRLQYRRLAHAAWRSAAVSRLSQGRRFSLDAGGHAAAHAVHERHPARAVLLDRPDRLEPRVGGGEVQEPHSAPHRDRWPAQRPLSHGHRVDGAHERHVEP